MLSLDILKELNRQLKKAEKACRGIESALRISLDDDQTEFGVTLFTDCSDEAVLTAFIAVPSWDVERTYTIGTYKDCYFPDVHEIMQGAFILLSMFVLEHMISEDTRDVLLMSLDYVRESSRDE